MQSYRSYKALAKGILTYVPVLRDHTTRGSGGTLSARYCYSVWLRHLVTLASKNLSTRPRVVAELGPGDSLGIGLAAMLSGADHYEALDVKAFANASTNLSVLDELIGLFQARARIPDDAEFPGVYPKLESYDFPETVLGAEAMAVALAPRRLDLVRSALKSLGKPGDISIRYVAPWDEPTTIRSGHIDLIFSQAVMEHVESLGVTYAAMHDWLVPGGTMSHVIDYRCHGTASVWSGHWCYSDLAWAVIKGTRPFLINRATHSDHVTNTVGSGFRIVSEDRRIGPAIDRAALAPRFASMSESDLVTQGAMITSVKP